MAGPQYRRYIEYRWYRSKRYPVLSPTQHAADMEAIKRIRKALAYPTTSRTTGLLDSAMEEHDDLTARGYEFQAYPVKRKI